MKTHRFTLIELLVVLALMGLLVGLAIPAFSRLNQGKAVNIAAQRVMRALEQAQAQAIGNRQYVALVIPNGGVDYSGAFGEKDTPAFNVNTHNLASFRPAFVYKNGPSSYDFIQWTPESSWSEPIENARVVQLVSYSGVPKAGDVYNGGVEKATASLSSQPAFKSVSGHGPCAVIFTPDGGLAATSDLFLVVQGCTANGGSFDYKGHESDHIVLHINRMSGKISYFEKP